MRRLLFAALAAGVLLGAVTACATPAVTKAQESEYAMTCEKVGVSPESGTGGYWMARCTNHEVTCYTMGESSIWCMPMMRFQGVGK